MSDELREVLEQGVKLLRTVYGSKADFAHEAQMWVLAAERVLEQPEPSIDGSTP